MIKSLITLILLFCMFIIIRVKVIKPTPSDTASGAIVMGIGIFVNGAMKNIPLLEENISQLSAMVVLLLWIFIWSSYLNSYFQRTIKERHLKNPIKSFAVGTWVAGSSVCWIAVYQRLPWLNTATRAIFFANLILWMFYMGICFRNYRAIFRDQLFTKVNGVMLITTVSTQSIVVLGSTVFENRFPIYASRFLISLGAAFYTIGFLLIVRRYFFTRSWNIEEDWLNTNCILHGAMSITGLASTVSGAVSSHIILLIWLWVILWFLIVEAIELYRVWKRIRKYGFTKGIITYDVTQWSRIFTFGMFYTFTMRFNLSLPPISNAAFLRLQRFILTNGTWIMIWLLAVEGLLFFKYESRNKVHIHT